MHLVAYTLYMYTITCMLCSYYQVHANMFNRLIAKFTRTRAHQDAELKMWKSQDGNVFLSAGVAQKP